MPDVDSITLLVVAALSLAALLRAMFGFGDALVAMPLLSLLIDMRQATPLVALTSITVAAGILVTEWRQIQFGSGLRLVFASLAGIPFGLLLLTQADPTIVKLLLACVILAFAGYSLFRPGTIRLTNDRWAPAFGFCAGVLGGAYNTQGPPLVMFGTMRGWSPAEFRATLQGFFLPTSLLILTGHWATGLWTPTVFWYFVAGLPGVVVALIVGRLVARRVQGRRFVRGVYAILVFVGVLLLVNVVSELCK